jgi:hypothetical protein
MLTFKEFLKETYDVKYRGKYEGTHSYTFDSPVGEYSVKIRHRGNSASVDFVDQHNNMNTTNKSKNLSVGIVRTVGKAVKEHLAKHPKIKNIGFKSINSEKEKGRQKLYGKITQKHSGTIKKGNTGELGPHTTYKIPTSNLKEDIE